MSVDVARNRAGMALHHLSFLLMRLAFWVEVWRCAECGAYCREPIEYDSFCHLCPECGKLAPV